METNKPAEEVTKEGKTKEDLEEKTFAAINGYLTASANEGRYPYICTAKTRRGNFAGKPRGLLETYNNCVI